MNLFCVGFEEFPLRSRRSLALFLSLEALLWLVGSAEAVKRSAATALAKSTDISRLQVGIDARSR